MTPYCLFDCLYQEHVIIVIIIIVMFLVCLWLCCCAFQYLVRPAERQDEDTLSLLESDTSGQCHRL